MKISEQTKIEAQAGYLIGMLIGTLGGWVFTMFFASWAWYFKLTTTIGEIGIVGMLGYSLSETIKARKNFLQVQKEMKEMNDAANTQVNTITEKEGNNVKES